MAITQHTLTVLDSMRLPDLWSLWHEVFGATTRNPNRKSLVTRLRTAIEARLAEAAIPEVRIGDVVEVASGWDGAGARGTVKEVIPMPEGGPTLLVEWADGTWAHTRAIRVRPVEAAGDGTPAETQDPDEPETEPSSDAAPEPELPDGPADDEHWSLDAEAGNAYEDDAHENDTTADTATAEAPGDADAARTALQAAGATEPNDAPAPVPLTKLSVEALRARYEEVIGRHTGSVSKPYLVWKLREAEKGRIPVGPRTAAHREGPAPEMMVLPLRMERDVVEAMDDAWKRLGIKNRMDLFRTALRAYFEGAGETEVAARL